MKSVSSLILPPVIRPFIILLTLLSAGCKTEPAAQTNVAASLIAETLTIQPARAFTVGIRLKMKPGWHTYWKEPGDSGLATSVRWTLPAEFKAGEIQWPQPERFQDSAGVTYGYTGEIILPVEITPPQTLNENDKITIVAEVKWLECSDICVVGKANLTLTLPSAQTAPLLNPETQKLFADTRTKIPTQPNTKNRRK